MSRKNKNRFKPDIANKMKLAADGELKYGRKPIVKDTRGNGRMEVDYFHFYESLYRKEIADWQTARVARYDPWRPLTYPLQQLYKDAMLDLHLQGAVANRILRVVNKELVVKDTEGNVDKSRSAIFQKRWMRHIIKKGMESKFYGYSLMFLDTSSDTPRIVDFNRESIVPELGVVLKNPIDLNAESIAYGDFSNYFLFASLGDDPVGMLERVAPMTIFKRHSWASWDEFEQIFGVPIRIARTYINSQSYKDELQSWLETMGTASYGIFDKQTDIEIKENNRSDAFNVFYQKILAVNKEISKGVVGQTMTMDDGSSQSQAEVHLQIYDEITTADIADVEDWLSDDVLPVFRNRGFDIPEGYYISLVEKEIVKPVDKIKIDAELLRNGYNLLPEYIETYYSTPLDPDNPRTIGGGMLSTDSAELGFFVEGAEAAPRRILYGLRSSNRSILRIVQRRWNSVAMMLQGRCNCQSEAKPNR